MTAIAECVTGFTHRWFAAELGGQEFDAGADWDRVITARAVLQGLAIAARCGALVT